MDAAEKLGRGQVPAYDAGMHGGWQAVGPCHKQRYLRYSPGSSSDGSRGDGSGGGSEAAAAGALLAQIRDELFATAAFAKLLSKVGPEARGGSIFGVPAVAAGLSSLLLFERRCPLRAIAL